MRGTGTGQLREEQKAAEVRMGVDPTVRDENKPS
jgi:hypothetical protein